MTEEVMPQAPPGSKRGRHPTGRWRHAATCVQACSACRIGRQVVRDWRFVPYYGPPAFLNTIYMLVGLLYWPVVIVVPRVRHMDVDPTVAILAFPLVWFAAMTLIWLVVNCGVLVVHLALFPFELGRRFADQVRSNWRALPRVEKQLGPWLAESDAAHMFRQVARRQETNTWHDLEPVQMMTYLIEQYNTDVLKRVPARTWPDLAGAGLGPRALAMLFRYSWQDATAGRQVLGVLLTRGRFDDPAWAPHLALELATLPATELAGVLDAVCDVDRPSGESIGRIFLAAQCLSDAAISRFMEAIGLTSLRVCEAALACASSARAGAQLD